MSAILAIETSTPFGSVAVVRGEEIIFERSFTSERSHNSQLFAPLREVLENCSGSLRAIVVGIGPASYTGVRIGIAAAQGLALSLNVPVLGWPSVAAVEPHPASPSYHVCGDARRGTFFLAEIRNRKLAGSIATLDADTFRRMHAAASPDDPWFTFDPKPPLQLGGIHCVRPAASELALAAAKLSDEELHQLAHQPLEPLYLSAPFVTMPRK